MSTTISRTWYNTLVDDSGSNLDGSVIDKADFDAILDAIDAIFADDIAMAPTKKLFLDGGGNTYIQEVSADGMLLHVGTIEGLYMTTTAFYAIAVYGDTTANATNMTVASDGRIQRSTSTRASKQDITPLNLDEAFPVVMGLQPVTFRGRGDTDSQHRLAGFVAEDVAPLAPILATYDADGSPNYVTYDRIPAYLVPVAQDHEARLAALEARLR